MQDRNIGSGDIGSPVVRDAYAPPTSDLLEPQSTEPLMQLKKRMQYCFMGSAVLGMAPSLFLSLAGGIPLLVLILGYLSPVLWIAMLVYIFRLNKRLSSVGYAMFRTLISLVPLLALYILYRTSYDANKIIQAARPARSAPAVRIEPR
jgi:predicted neutral ceramidase superfamily lipid hydrolase